MAFESVGADGVAWLMLMISSVFLPQWTDFRSLIPVWIINIIINTPPVHMEYTCRLVLRDWSSWGSLSSHLCSRIWECRFGNAFLVFDFILTAEQFIASEISWQVMGMVNLVYWARVHFL